MNNHKTLLTFMLLGVSLLLTAAELTLVQSGKGNAAIILGKKPTASAQLGAYELQHWVKKITGAVLPIRTETASEKVKIYIGDTLASRKNGIKKEDFKGENYVVRSTKEALFLAGNDSDDFTKVDYKKVGTFPKNYFAVNGSLYAVYDFLEKECKVTFCGPWENSVAYPTMKTLKVKVENRSFTPGMNAFRKLYDDDRSYSLLPFTERERQLWQHRWRLNSIYGATNHNCYTIYYQHWGKAKSPHLAKEFKGKKSDLFAQGYKGTNSYMDAGVRSQYPNDPDLPPQLCFSNKETMKFFAKEAFIYYNGKNVRGGFWNGSGRIDPNTNLTPRIKGYPFFYPVESADSNLFCKCKNCVGLYKELKGDIKTSHLKFHFISGIAKEAAKLHKNVGISTLSYIQTLPYPHKIKIPSNVSIQICLTQFAWWHPAIRKAQEAEYNKWLKYEGKKRPLTLWLYLFSPHWDGKRHYHYNSFPGLYPWKAGEMMKKFASDGIKGFFSEVELQYSLAEAYVSARIAFDPSLDVNKVVDDWMQASYGKAAPFMKEIYKISQDAYWNHKNYPKEWFKDLNKPIGPRGPHNPYWGTALQSEDVNWGYGTKERFQKIEKLLARAQKLVKTPSEKALLQNFIKGIWNTARKGRSEYDVKLANMGKYKLPSMTAFRVPDAKGDPRKVDWSKIKDGPFWKYTKSGEAHPKKIRIKSAADKEYLYLAYEELSAPGKSGSGTGFWSNCAEIFFSEMPYVPACHVAVGTNGELRQYFRNIHNDIETLKPCDLSIKLYNENKGDSWKWKMAIPLRKLPLGKYKTGMTVNFFRSLPKRTSAAWAPLFFTANYMKGLAQYGRLQLEEIVYEEDVFTWGKRGKDPAAGNGSCGIMDGNKGWSLRSNLGPIEKGKYFVDVMIRTEAKGDKDLTTRVGFYDRVAKKIVTVKPIAVKDISSASYKKVTLGPLVLSQDAYFYIGGFSKKNVKPNRIFLDKIVLRKAMK